MLMSIQPFEVRIPDETLDDLKFRLARTRLAPDPANDWNAGMNPTYLRELVDYWRSCYDWRDRERAINRFHHYRVAIHDTLLHFIHERGVGPSPFPLVLTHGFPDSFLRFQKILPLLTDPGAHGGDPSDAFDVIVPSLPGYGFSAALEQHAATFHVGDLWHRLMTDELGYTRYGAHGGDWGSTVTEHLARSHGRQSVVGIHLTDVPFWHAFQKPRDLSPAETAFMEHNESFQMSEGAYSMIQGMRLRTLADGLSDSPAGLAAWLVEKFQRWSDCGDDP
jgi:pimeloyl-ACP methyl ester carboxylesterase